METTALLPGSRRYLLTIACEASGASAAMTDGTLWTCWQTEAGTPHPTATTLFDMVPASDAVVVREILDRLTAGDEHVHRTGASGATYYAHDGRGTELDRIVWYWHPAGASDAAGPASGGGEGGQRRILGVGPGGTGQGAKEPTGLDLLSDRERAVVGPLLAGLRVKTISRSLFLSESTVRSHLSAAFKKLGVRTQAELVERYGLARPPTDG